MLRIKGTLIVFDKPDLIGHMFPKDCEITNPNNVPILALDSDPISNTKQVGDATNFIRSDHCITFDGYINGKDEDTYKQLLKDPGLYCGGFYRRVKSHGENVLEVISSMELCSIGLYLGDVFGDGSLRLEVVENERKTES